MLHCTNKNHYVFLIEFSIITAIIAVPVLVLFVFLFKHQALVLSTEAWLILLFAYQIVLLLTAPITYSLVLEFYAEKNNQNEKSLHQETGTATIPNTEV